MALRFAYVAAVAAGSSPASTPASPASTANLEKLQALVSQLVKDPVNEPEPMPSIAKRPAPEPQRNVRAGDAVGVMRIASQGAAGMPDAESDSSVLVFDKEAETSVQRAIRRLQPSPAASASRQLPQPSTYCTECDFFFNGATDSAGADMCMKPEANKKTACFAKYGEACPFDMDAYTCAGNAPSSPPSPEPDGCHAARMKRYRDLTAENEALMATYLQLKMDEMQMIEDAITKAEQDSYCQCSPIETVSSILGVA